MYKYFFNVLISIKFQKCESCENQGKPVHWLRNLQKISQYFVFLKTTLLANILLLKLTLLVKFESPE